MAACGSGGDDAETVSLIHRLLQASTNDESGDLKTFAGKLPDGLPVEPPLYHGAKLIVSSRQPAATGVTPTPDSSGNISQPLLYLIVLDTPDSREKVYEFYEEALEKDPWQIESVFSEGRLDTFQFSDVGDADINGFVTIAGGGEDDRTSVLISLQDAGAFREKVPPFKLGESLPIPKQFPSDVPTYDRGTVTGSAFVRQPGDESFLLAFLTRDSKEDVVNFYRTEFQKLGWTVQSGTPLGVEERTDFNNSAGDIQGEIIANTFTRDPRYTDVKISFRQAPSREPATATTPVRTNTSAVTPTVAPAPRP